MKLNLGCGRDIREGWINVDRKSLPGVDVVWDMATEPAPFEVDSVDEMLLSHVIEHLANPLVVMEKLWRIAKPGELITIRCPHGASDDAHEDPTHVRAMFPNSFMYFGQPAYHRADYGYRGDWRTTEVVYYMDVATADQYPTLDQLIEGLRHQRNMVQEMLVVMEAVKPAREPVLDPDATPVTVEVKVVE